MDRSEDPGFTAPSETPENVSSSHSSEGISPSGTPRSESSYASGDVSPSGTPVRLPWSGWAWAAFVVGAIASLAPPFRLLWDLAAIVLALIARHRIMGGPGWALTAARPRARGIWLANVAFLLGALDLFLVAWFTL